MNRSITTKLERGAQYVEYSMVLLAMAVLLIFIVTILGKDVKARLEDSNNELWGNSNLAQP